MQPELKSRLEDAAAKSGRSMNSEIVARLEQTFSSEPVASPGSGRPELPELKLTLDTGDDPICWDEIHEYLQAIRKTITLDVVQLSVMVKTPALVSSADRDKETQALANKLHKKP